MQTLSEVEFMKKYSSIPNAFIIKYFKIYEKMKNGENFAIDLDTVVSWLGCSRDSLLDTLFHSYEENVDYIKTKVRPKSNKGRSRYEIKVTIDCFKQIAQQTRSKNGKMVRLYFIECERLLMQYRADLDEKIKQRMEELERNQRPKGYKPGEGFVYAFRASEKYDNLHKIGRSTDLKRRIREHSSSKMDDIDIVYAARVEDPIAVESCMKTMLKKTQYRKYKEVYQVDIDTIKTVAALCYTGDRSVTLKRPLIPKKAGNYYIMLDMPASHNSK